jgi:DNA polymerase
VGEAPGESEDVLGKPFAGPAGRLLEEMMHRAGIPVDPAQGVAAFTNIVCCILRDDFGTKVAQPPKESIDACRERLKECIGIVKPECIIWVGQLAEKYGPMGIPEDYHVVSISAIIHPAAILRMGVAQQGLAFQRTVVALTDVMESLE